MRQMSFVVLVAALSGCSSSGNSPDPQNASAGGTTASTSGGSSIGGGTAASGAGGAAQNSTCIGAKVLSDLGKTHILAGASMADATAAKAKADLRYLYLSGGIFDGNAPCTSCASG